MGKLVWYQDFDGEVKEVNNIDFGQVPLMSEGTGWWDGTYYLLGKGDAIQDFSLYHAHVLFKWTGEQSLYNCNFVLSTSKRYTGSSDADSDITEIQDWAYNGWYGYNRFPTACQIYNPCRIILEDDDPGFHVESYNDCAHGWDDCTNLGEMSHNRCLPCIDVNENIINFNMSEEWTWLDVTGNTCEERVGDRRAMYVYSGGLLISQGEDAPTQTSWQQFNNNSSDVWYKDNPDTGRKFGDKPFTIPVEEDGVLAKDELTHIYLRMCIPWGCFCGGKRTIGFGLDYIYTK